MKDNELQIQVNFITDVAIGVTSEEHLVVAGFYGSRDTFSIDGSFYLKMDIQSQKVISSNEKAFDKEFIQLGMSEREKKKSDKKEAKGEDIEMPNFDLDRLVTTDDGGWLLMAEQFYITTRTYVSSGPNGSMSTRTVTYYNYDDIIVVRMNAKGEIEWNVKVPKHQVTSGATNMLSYTWSSCNGSIYIVYNDSPASRGNNVMAAVISKDGTISNETIIPADKDELNFYPSYSARTKECQMLIYSARKRTYRFSVMDIQR